MSEFPSLNGSALLLVMLLAWALFKRTQREDDNK